MARVRLMLLALAACRAEAEPASQITAPPGWRALPELAPKGGEAWGEPAMGCYAIRTSEKAADPQRILDGIAGEKIVTRDVVKAQGELSLAFERGGYHGKLRALTAAGRTNALACFWNQREPARCEAACGPLLGSLR